MKTEQLGIVDKNQNLHVFIGIDEYQSIEDVKGIPVGKEPLLQDLINVIGTVVSPPMDGVRIYPMFAGN